MADVLLELPLYELFSGYQYYLINFRYNMYCPLDVFRLILSLGFWLIDVNATFSDIQRREKAAVKPFS